MQAATVEFAAYGLGGGRIDKIARQAGANKRMIYHYFGDKEGLYIEVLDRVFGKMREAELSLDFSGVTPMRGVELITRFIWRYFVSNPEILSLLGTENLFQARFLATAPNGIRVNRKLVKKLKELLAQGEDDHASIEDADALMLFLTIASLSFFYLSNRFTLSTIFNIQLDDTAMLARWEEHIVHTVLRSLLFKEAGEAR